MKIISIDEASMLKNEIDESKDVFFGSGRCLDDLVEYSEVQKRDDVRLIFVGDKNQLFPVKEKFSPALCEQYIKDRYGLSCASVELTENHRQKDMPELIEFLEKYLSRGGLS